MTSESEFRFTASLSLPRTNSISGGISFLLRILSAGCALAQRYKLVGYKTSSSPARLLLWDFFLALQTQRSEGKLHHPAGRRGNSELVVLALKCEC